MCEIKSRLKNKIKIKLKNKLIKIKCVKFMYKLHKRVGFLTYKLALYM